MSGHPQSSSCQPQAHCYQPQEAQCHQQPEPCQYEHNDCGQQHCDSLSLQLSVDLNVDFGRDCRFCVTAATSHSSSGSLAMLAAMRLASSRVSKPAAIRRASHVRANA